MKILIFDFSQLVIANVAVLCANKSMKPEEITVDTIRHLALNQLRSIKLRHSSYKNVVIACDGRGYWRKNVFPYYKARRKQDREALNIPWALVYEALDTIRAELAEFFPYRVVMIDGAEADDVIATLVKTYYNDESEGIMIISTDKDFQQLQNYHGVKQYNPVKKAMYTCSNPKQFLKELIIRGDGGDGVPNFLSPDDIFITEGRQKSIMQKKLDEWLTQEPAQFCTTEEMKRNWKRNEQLIDFAYIPDEITEKIVSAYEGQAGKDRSQLFNYFLKKKLKLLSEHIGDF